MPQCRHSLRRTCWQHSAGPIHDQRDSDRVKILSGRAVISEQATKAFSAADVPASRKGSLGDGPVRGAHLASCGAGGRGGYSQSHAQAHSLQGDSACTHGPEPGCEGSERITRNRIITLGLRYPITMGTLLGSGCSRPIHVTSRERSRRLQPDRLLPTLDLRVGDSPNDLRRPTHTRGRSAGVPDVGPSHTSRHGASSRGLTDGRPGSCKSSERGVHGTWPNTDPLSLFAIRGNIGLLRHA